MVEDTVQHDVHVPIMRRGQQLGESGITAKQRVDSKIVMRMIAVI
jgi:hypothetical protein